MDYRQKYLKYKAKYLDLKSIVGGEINGDTNVKIDDDTKIKLMQKIQQTYTEPYFNINYNYYTEEEINDAVENEDVIKAVIKDSNIEKIIRALNTTKISLSDEDKIIIKNALTEEINNDINLKNLLDHLETNKVLNELQNQNIRDALYKKEIILDNSETIINALYKNKQIKDKDKTKIIDDIKKTKIINALNNPTKIKLDKKDKIYIIDVLNKNMSTYNEIIKYLNKKIEDTIQSEINKISDDDLIKINNFIENINKCIINIKEIYESINKKATKDFLQYLNFSLPRIKLPDNVPHTLKNYAREIYKLLDITTKDIETNTIKNQVYRDNLVKTNETVLQFLNFQLYSTLVKKFPKYNKTIEKINILYKILEDNNLQTFVNIQKKRQIYKVLYFFCDTSTKLRFFQSDDYVNYGVLVGIFNDNKYKYIENIYSSTIPLLQKTTQTPS